MIPNLNKENFWNDLESKFPDAVKDFYEWIDRYKVESNWDKVFKCDEGTGQVLKFHEINFEMQVGILARYIVEKMAGDDTGYYFRMATGNYREDLVRSFADFQSDIIKAKGTPIKSDF